MLAANRPHNLKTHILTHDKERSKQFVCPTCRGRFTRKHDLKRHCRYKHGDLRESLSAYPGSVLTPGPATGVPEDSFQGM